MTTIWKFPLETTDKQWVPLPHGAVVLDVQIQNGVPCLWALVDPNVGKGDRLFLTFGTGHPVKGQGAYVGTYQTGPFVWHVFEAAA